MPRSGSGSATGTIPPSDGAGGSGQTGEGSSGEVTVVNLPLLSLLPAAYQFTFQPPTNSLPRVGDRVAFDWNVTDANGGDVPVPANLLLELLDGNGNSLVPPVYAESMYPGGDSALAASLVFGGVMHFTLEMVGYVQLSGILDRGDSVSGVGGSGVQKFSKRALVRVLA